MRVQVGQGGMVRLPGQAMRALGIREQDFLEWSLTQTGILFVPTALTSNMAGPKKN